MTRKQTSPRVSSAAARLLARLPKHGFIWVIPGGHLIDLHYASELCTIKHIRSLLASLVSQDETAGQVASQDHDGCVACEYGRFEPCPLFGSEPKKKPRKGKRRKVLR